ncbi:unnamed protein product [Rotaria sordida]|uniref:Uncharacterized protein n=1 Tax=Rotaria sordida TaxID=392033 RepID=A0A815DK80_9BILA|nr:unnamed protein product [Rotaria sordida]
MRENDLIEYLTQRAMEYTFIYFQNFFRYFNLDTNCGKIFYWMGLTDENIVKTLSEIKTFVNEYTLDGIYNNFLMRLHDTLVMNGGHSITSLFTSNMNKGKFDEYIILYINKELLENKQSIKNLKEKISLTSKSNEDVSDSKKQQNALNTMRTELSKLKGVMLDEMRENKENYSAFDLLISNKYITNIPTLDFSSYTANDDFIKQLIIEMKNELEKSAHGVSGAGGVISDPDGVIGLSEWYDNPDG